MPTIHLQRCLNHPAREAVARCPECTNFFCRECVTEHENRMICSTCLSRIHHSPVIRRNRLTGIYTAAKSATAFFALWLLFYGMGRLLLIVPEDFHEGTVWEDPWWETE